MAEEKAPIIVRKIKKGHGGHHGGAWKVAYADFVTAMMAFFMVMWIVGISDKQKRAAISDYFNNPSATVGHSQTPAAGANGPGGASNALIDMGGGMNHPVPDSPPNLKPSKPVFNPNEARKAAEEADKQRLEALRDELKKAIDRSQALEPFKDQLLLDITREGLRIQIVDKQNRPMFDLGGASLKPYTVAILHELAGFIQTVPNHISISGHTDITQYGNSHGYTNWELSTERANAARRSLIDGGMSENRIDRIVGLASTVLFDKQKPDNPINRRISIVVMNAASADAETRNAEATVDETSPTPPPDAVPPIPAAAAAPATPPAAAAKP